MAKPALAQETVCALRRQIARIEGNLPELLSAAAESVTNAVVSRYAGRPAATLLATGVEGFDRAAGGGIPAAGLTEIHGAASRDAGSVSGFALGLSRLAFQQFEADATMPGSGSIVRASPVDQLLLWIGTSEVFREAGRPYALGLVERFGISPRGLVTVVTEKPVEALRVAEDAATLGLFAAILLELRGSPDCLDLTATRRLHRRALDRRRPLFLLRHAGMPAPTAAPLRLLVSAAPAGLRLTLGGPLEGSIGPPAFQIAFDKNRTGQPATFTLEWNNDAFAFEERTPTAGDGAMVSVPAGGARVATALRKVVAFEDAEGRATADLQSSRGQHPTGGGIRRAG